VLLEEVVPWLYDRIGQYLSDDIFIKTNLENIVEQAFDDG